MAAPSIVINIFNFKINSFENASAVNVGQNILAEWHNSDKKNQGFGSNYGDSSSFSGLRNLVDDRDVIDDASITRETAKPLNIERWEES
ncbi:hypothetical protein MUN89_19590 [Halobacillus salinarum]|uniref:Uncharacterized protein n=1 Tax=Halobacillus salinarum TaxID=2932257 RepID=A0ABY4EIX3_9BACI|nr:hypothetical protein [Halobacillus salinarum]UOQ44041.1 hypothetical protein MUN89_19590 [Halobacillus salinarum]